MVNLKTKTEKHAQDNEKRRRSIKEKEKAKLNQSQIIKQALSSINLNGSSSKKIVFSDNEVNEEETIDFPKEHYKSGKPVLFDSSASEDEEFVIKEKSQFKGKKGFELLNLQSTYGNDERFKIDERFLEEEKEDFEDEKEPSRGENHIENKEKEQQIKILESVLGTSVTEPKSEKKTKKRVHEMVRYDASNKEHEIYEIAKETKPETPKSASKKRKERKKMDKSKVGEEELPKPVVSKEKFYEVSNEIKSSFKEKKDEGGQFSLLQTYGLNEEVSQEEEVFDNNDFEEESSMDEVVQAKSFVKGNKYENSDQVQKVIEEQPKPKKKTVLAKGIWKESFFFKDDDERFKEGLEFINKKDSEQAQEAAEIYDITRRKLKEILRLHLKKQIHKKDPFKHKVGGMNKKQMANSKFKNSRNNFINRNPRKKNPARRT